MDAPSSANVEAPDGVKNEVEDAPIVDLNPHTPVGETSRTAEEVRVCLS